MSITHQLTQTLQLSGSIGVASLQSSVSYTAEGEANIDVTVTGVQTNRQIAWECDVSQNKTLYILADKDCTLETNSGSSPTDTLALKAGKPLVWHADGYLPHPFSADVTALFLTTTETTRLRIYSGNDATP